jgi:hypothetical protein
MIVFSQDTVIKTSATELIKKGYRDQQWKTVFNCFRNEAGECIYLDTQKNVFFKNAHPTSRPVFKVIVAGSRNFEDDALMERKLDNILRNKVKEYDIEIIEGDASGADKAGGRYADSKGYRKTVMPADWDGYGLSAGPRRNEEMARYAVGGGCVCFWDGKSKGTRHMIEMAKKYKLNILIVNFQPKPKKPFTAKGI